MEDARDEMSVSNMVASAISAAAIKALELERDEAISSLNLQFKAILKRMQGEFRSSRERWATFLNGGSSTQSFVVIYHPVH